MKKYLFGGVLGFAVIIIGFILLLRGCLAGYDERSAISPALFFEKEGKAVVFTIVKFDQATSYKSGGGITTKSVSTSYHIQINDALTGEKLNKKKIMGHSKIRNYPVSVMGNGNGHAWVFINEPMAFDPFTLEKFADRSIIESRNPQLAGKMPNEKRYYTFNGQTGELFITATDGLSYVLSTATLMARPVDEDEINADPSKAAISKLEKETKALQDQSRAYYDRFRDFNKMLNEKKISYNQYLDSTKDFNRKQDTLSARQRRIRDEIDLLKTKNDKRQGRQEKIEDLNSGRSASYTDMCTGEDTLNGKWYGLKTAAELESDPLKFEYRPVYTETARNKMYTSAYRAKDPPDRWEEVMVDKPEKLSDEVFLQGGFLLDKSTAMPIHLPGNAGFIVCYREKVGNDGAILIARLGLDGHAQWSVNTALKSFLDWIYTGKQLIILGTDNKELSSGEANVLFIIDLQTGKASVHDYFTDKMRKP